VKIAGPKTTGPVQKPPVTVSADRRDAGISFTFGTPKWNTQVRGGKRFYKIQSVS
jgi:hypothetical protein